jgi:hypothetical protein
MSHDTESEQDIHIQQLKDLYFYPPKSEKVSMLRMLLPHVGPNTRIHMIEDVEDILYLPPHAPKSEG